VSASDPSFLFSSDFHGRGAAFESFASTLAGGPYTGGVLGGDLLDEWLPDAEVDGLVGGEAQGTERLTLALQRRQNELQRVLESAGKPIVFVLGNHDVAPWADTALLTNAHLRAVELAGARFVGYRWTRMDRYPHELEADVPTLAAMVDESTVLLTHSPPWGVLDGHEGARFRFGLKTLHRLPSPRLHLFGHVHECAGVEGSAVNGSWPAFRKFFAVRPHSGQIAVVDPVRG